MNIRPYRELIASNANEVRYARKRLSEIRDRLGYIINCVQNRTDSFFNHIEDENVQFFIKIMFECMHEADGLKGFQENLIPSRFKMFFDAEKHLIEYIDSKIAR